MTAVGRLMRHDGTGWSPVGEPLPPFAHAPPSPSLLIAPWILPKELAPRPYDVIVVGELAHQLMARCPEDDQAYLDLAQQTMLFQDPDVVMAWLAEIELWIGRRLDQQRPWPEPPAEQDDRQ